MRVSGGVALPGIRVARRPPVCSVRDDAAKKKSRAETTGFTKDAVCAHDVRGALGWPSAKASLEDLDKAAETAASVCNEPFNRGCT